ncbi:hypothetical protein ACPC54_06565 [Kitasatospora sp. NPDC094028]
MGTDINGFIEYRPRAGWEAAIDLDALYDTRDYDAFGCLFGVKNHAGFRPLAPGRGLPGDAHERTRAAFDRWEAMGGVHSPTWIAWAELAAVDWDEPAERPDERVRMYLRGPDGAWVLRGKALRGHGSRAEGEEWTEGEARYRIGRMTRREAVPPDGPWAPVFTVMRTLAHLHGDENVRLTVWFDS